MTITADIEVDRDEAIRRHLRAIEALPDSLGGGEVEAVELPDDLSNEQIWISVKQERVDRADAAREAAEAEWEKFSFLPELVRWLEMYCGRGGQLAHQPLPAAKPVKEETHRAAVERIRKQLSACDDEWARLETIPLPASELKARITAEVDAIAALGKPQIQNQDRFGDGVSGLAPALRLRRTGEMIVSDAPSPFLCWLRRSEIIERLHAEVDALDQADAMSDDQRDQAFSRLLDQKLALAFSEESLIVAAAAEGTTIQRRRDADPRAILEVQEVFS